MATTVDIPITVQPEAAAWVERRGLRNELDRMLDYLKRNVPGLRAIVVELDADADPEAEASIILGTVEDDPGPITEEEPSQHAWRVWFGSTFSPDVCRHFVRLSSYEPADGR